MKQYLLILIRSDIHAIIYQICSIIYEAFRLYRLTRIRAGCFIMVNRIDPLDSSYDSVALPATYKVAIARQVTPVTPKEVPKQPLPSGGERFAGMASQAGQQADNKEAEQAKKQPTPKLCIACTTGGGTAKAESSGGAKPSVMLVTHVCPECGQVHTSGQSSDIDSGQPPQQLDIHV
jgi:hypothetical protein